MASKDVLVCGTLNLETTFPIARFPLNYEAICYRPFEIRSQPSGVGFNIARALSTLGNRVRLVSMVGSDFLGTVLRQSMAKFGVSDDFILPILDQTPQSIVIFDGAGRPDAGPAKSNGIRRLQDWREWRFAWVLAGRRTAPVVRDPRHLGVLFP